MANFGQDRTFRGADKPADFTWNSLYEMVDLLRPLDTYLVLFFEKIYFFIIRRRILKISGLTMHDRND